jgi:hypothetical protein
MLLDARRQKVAHPAALVEYGATIESEAHDRAEQSLLAAGITGQRPPQKAESPEYLAVLRRRQTTWPARPDISAHGARETSKHPLLP